MKKYILAFLTFFFSFFASTFAFTDTDHYEWKNTLTLRPHENHTITTGFNSVLIEQSRGVHTFLENDIALNTIDLGEERAIETGIYLSDEWNLSDRFSIDAGIRYNIFNSLGPRDIYQYESDSYSLDNISIR